MHLEFRKLLSLVQDCGAGFSFNADPCPILEKNTDPDPTPPTPSKNWIRNQDTVKEQLSDIF